MAGPALAQKTKGICVTCDIYIGILPRTSGTQHGYKKENENYFCLHSTSTLPDAGGSRPERRAYSALLLSHLISNTVYCSSASRCLRVLGQVPEVLQVPGPSSVKWK
ncbi:hypothetical protein VULLAG_LOCUS1398 [Vulpes lagopus]